MAASSAAWGWLCPKASSWRSGRMHLYFQNRDSRGDTQNPYQNNPKSHNVKIHSIRASNKKSVIARSEVRLWRMAISSLQQPKPHFVRSANPLPINFHALPPRGPPPFVILSGVRHRRTESKDLLKIVIARSAATRQSQQCLVLPAKLVLDSDQEAGIQL